MTEFEEKVIAFLKSIRIWLILVVMMLFVLVIHISMVNAAEVSTDTLYEYAISDTTKVPDFMELSAEVNAQITHDTLIVYSDRHGTVVAGWGGSDMHSLDIRQVVVSTTVCFADSTDSKVLRAFNSGTEYGWTEISQFILPSGDYEITRFPDGLYRFHSEFDIVRDGVIDIRDFGKWGMEYGFSPAEQAAFQQMWGRSAVYEWRAE